MRRGARASWCAAWRRRASGEGRAARSDRELESRHAAAACAINSSMQEAKQ